MEQAIKDGEGGTDSSEDGIPRGRKGRSKCGETRE